MATLRAKTRSADGARARPRTAGPAVARLDTDSPSTRDNSEVSWQQVVTAVAAAAGGAAWVSAVGSSVVALRLRAADLPVEPVVALMSNEHRFAIGAGVLLAPLLAGLIAFLADWALAGDPDKRPHWQRQVLAAVTVIFGLALAYLVLDPPTETIIAEGAFVLVAVLVALHFLKSDPELRHTFRERLVIFLSVLVAAGIGAAVAEMWRPPSFDDVDITLRERGSHVLGGYITSTDYAVVIATTCNLIEAVPRAEISLISVGPGKFRC